VSGGVLSSTTPTAVGSWSCNTGDNEKFPLTNMEWRGLGNMCITASGTTSGATLSAQTCAGSSLQKWSFLDGDPNTAQRFDQIRLVGTNLCVSTATSAGALGEPLKLRDCSMTDTKQRFTYPGRGVIGFGNWCMNVSGGLPNPPGGVPPALGLWNGCGANPGLDNEVFNLTGMIKTVQLPRSGGGFPLTQCLNGSNRNQVTVSTCDSANVNQTWDYYL
jgi:hypothetical protein